jgi:hypothetical protein
LHVIAVGMQLPATHASVVQALPSVQVFVLSFVNTHPVAGLHVSSVHALLSLQAIAVEMQLPAALHASVVHRLPSVQVFVTSGVYTHPVAGLHVSSVHALPSLQITADPPTHAPLLHTSPDVQKLPSSHGSVLFVYAQPDAGLHESLVHQFPSTHAMGGPPTHTPPAHASGFVHALPSLHAVVLFVHTQPVAGAHVSSVHRLPSVQFRTPVGVHVPAVHTSPVVHALPSSQSSVLFTA